MTAVSYTFMANHSMLVPAVDWLMVDHFTSARMGACKHVILEPQEILDCAVGLLEQDYSYLVGVSELSREKGRGNGWGRGGGEGGGKKEEEK